MLTYLQHSVQRLIEWICQINVGHYDDGGGDDIDKGDGEEENGDG